MDKDIIELKNLRAEFVRIFNRNKLETMTIDEYSLRTGDDLSKESFCYWVEIKLRELGSMKGGTAAKFGTYFGYDRKQDSLFQRRWVSWTGESFETIRQALLELYDAGEAEDIETIKSSPLSPMFKGKLLSLYFPYRYLNIFTEVHLHHFLNKLSIPYKPSDDPVVLANVLSRQLQKNILTSSTLSNDMTQKLIKFLKGRESPKHPHVFVIAPKQVRF